MQSIDGYLSRIAQTADPVAVVTHADARAYQIESPIGTPIYGLGDTHSEAQQAVRVWVRSIQAGRGRRSE